MDFFQGSSPPNFISFCLGNQSENESQIRTKAATGISDELDQTSALATAPNTAQGLITSPPPFPPIRPPRLPSSTGSSVDVNAYAEERVRLHEEIQQITDQQKRSQIAEDPDPVEEEGEDRQTKTDRTERSLGRNVPSTLCQMVRPGTKGSLNLRQYLTTDCITNCALDLGVNTTHHCI